MQKLAADYGTAMIWITHDLSVIAGLADEIAVMYAGRIVETGAVDDVLDRPLHPYTHGLIGSVPSRNRRGEPLPQIPGMTPSPAEPAAGLRLPRRAARAPTRRAARACRRRSRRRTPAALLPSILSPLRGRSRACSH